jgi:hypothetical protein
MFVKLTRGAFVPRILGADADRLAISRRVAKHPFIVLRIGARAAA